MKHTEFSHLKETCPKCNNTLMLEKRNWSNISGALYYVFCEPCHCKGNGANNKETALANFHKELTRKEKLALRKPEKILTDIRDYLVAKAELVRERDMEFIEQSAMLQLIAIEHKELKEYAEKMRVEL